MGLSRAAAHFLIDTVEQLELSGSILTLGRQDLGFDINDLPEKIAKKIKDNKLTDKSFFKALGFNDVSVLDFSDYEGAELIGDLNAQELEINKQFDVVLDTGTLEHLFHIPNALANIYDLLNEGGRVIHVLPAANRLEHGFYMFSPTLFWDYYQENQFIIEKSYILRNYREGRHYIWEIFALFPGELDWLSMGKLNGDSYSNIFIAKKHSNSSKRKIPNQRRARNFWQLNEHISDTSSPDTSISKLKRSIWLIGYNRYSQVLAQKLSEYGFKIEGFVDNFKYGYQTDFGVIQPSRIVEYCESSSFIFCLRNAKLESRNGALSPRLASDMSLVSYFFDDVLVNDEALKSIHESALIKALDVETDKALKLPHIKTY